MKKKSLLVTAFTALALFIGTSANAQSSKSQLRFGIGVDGLFPVGNLHDVANFGVGITPRLQYGIASNVALTLTSGFYHFFTKDIYVPTGTPGIFEKVDNDLGIIPVKAGIKAFVSSNIYFGAEIGAGFEVEGSNGKTKLIASPTIGYASKKWDFGFRYENFSGQGNNYGLLGFRIAYGLGL